jgi:hypothetical protein
MPEWKNNEEIEKHAQLAEVILSVKGAFSYYQ